MYQLFYDGDKPPELRAFQIERWRNEIARGSSGKDARFLTNLRRLLIRAQELDRKLLMPFAQKLASKRNGKSIAS